MLLWLNSQLAVKCLLPNAFHIAPIVDDAMLDRVAQWEHTTFSLGLVANKHVFFGDANHYAWVTWYSNYGRKHTQRTVIARKARFHYARAIVDHYWSRSLFNFGSHSCYSINFLWKLLWYIYIINLFQIGSLASNSIFVLEDDDWINNENDCRQGDLVLERY